MSPSPYVEFDSHEAAIQHGGIQHIRDLRDAGRRAIEAATGRPAKHPEYPYGYGCELCA